jgi:hypothetical protein
MFNFIKDKVAPNVSAGLTAGLKNATGFNKQRALAVSNLFSVPLDDYATTGERDAVLASSGMGKSYLTGVIMEETLETGGLICVIDPEGEHFTLAERYPMMIIGGEHAHLPLEIDAIDLYVETMLKFGLSAVFDLSDYLDEEQQQYYGHIADKLFNAEQKYRRKIRIIVEEAQIYAPQRTGMASATRSKKQLMDPVIVSQKLAKRGRKRAIDSLWATQRPASINKDILSQCNRFWFGGITAEQDYKAVKPFLNEAGISFAEIKALQPGMFYFYSKGKTKLIKIRKRYCQHAGATPEAGMHFQAVTNHSLSDALTQLSEQVSRRASEKAQEKSESTRLKSIIHDLEEQNRKLREELEQEKLATKVIDRLGATPTDSTRRRASQFAKSKARAGGLSVIDGADDSNTFSLDDDDDNFLPDKVLL